MKDIKTILAVVLVIGIILIGVGVFQWQDGLNMQKITSAEELTLARHSPSFSFTPEQQRGIYTDYYGIKDRVEAGENKEVIGLTLLAVGVVVTIGSGIGLMVRSSNRSVVER